MLYVGHQSVYVVESVNFYLVLFEIQWNMCCSIITTIIIYCLETIIFLVAVDESLNCLTSPTHVHARGKVHLGRDCLSKSIAQKPTRLKR